MNFAGMAEGDKLSFCRLAEGVEPDSNILRLIKVTR
jgi:hypothetical protein